MGLNLQYASISQNYQLSDTLVRPYQKQLLSLQCGNFSKSTIVYLLAPTPTLKYTLQV